MSIRTVAIVQARMASTRLPGKVLMEIEGKAMLGRVVERTQKARLLAEIVLATSSESPDDPIAAYCQQHGVACFRGSHLDVLDRYFRAAQGAHAEEVVRITADCPLIDPGLIDETVRIRRAWNPAAGRRAAATLPTIDFAATRLPPPWERSFPIGLDIEVCSMAALERAWKMAVAKEDREHVMPYLYKGVKVNERGDGSSTGESQNGFWVALLNCQMDLGKQRWTVDTPQDLDFVRSVYRELGGRAEFTWLDVVRLLQDLPDLLAINAAIPHKSMEDVDVRLRGGHLE